jgi:metal-sulfur cluster biosynthetic enzyme
VIVSADGRSPHDIGDPRVVADIRRALDSIGDPCSVGSGVPMGIEEMGLVQAVEVDPEGNAVIRLRLTSPTCHMVAYFKVEAEERARQVPGVRRVRAVSDTGLDWSPDMMSPAATERRRAAWQARGLMASS